MGRIINLGSLAGRSASGEPRRTLCLRQGRCFSFAAIYSKRRRPIWNNCKYSRPGTTLTERVTALLTPEKRETFTRASPLGHLAEPDEIAGVITFLASEESRYITGATIDVNGAG